MPTDTPENRVREGELTHLLRDAGEEGVPAAAILPIVYAELRRLAAVRMAQEQPGVTLQPTALVHEAFMRLVGGASAASWRSRSHFFAAAAEAMRRILIDEARKRLAQKRGGGHQRQALSLDELPQPELSEELLALDEGLDKLAQAHAPAAELVKLRYFTGLTVQEAAECLGVSPRTANHYWAYARAFLLREVESDR